MRPFLILLCAACLSTAGWFARGAYNKSAKHDQKKVTTAQFIPDASVLDNPFETPEEKAEKARRQGISFSDAASNEIWLKIRREDGSDITKGTPVETTVIESTAEPMVTTTREGEWSIRFKAKPSNSK